MPPPKRAVSARPGFFFDHNAAGAGRRSLPNPGARGYSCGMLHLRLAACFVAACALLAAADWPQWRGPFLNGSSTATNLPVQWNKTDDALWKLPLPGRSGATPVVSADRVFVTSPDEQKALWLLSVDRRTGKEVWRRKVASGDQVVAKNNMATPSPIIDGQRVVATFGTGDVAAYDFDG